MRRLAERHDIAKTIWRERGRPLWTGGSEQLRALPVNTSELHFFFPRNPNNAACGRQLEKWSGASGSRGVFVFAFSWDRLMRCFTASRTRLQLDLQTWETVNIYTWAHKSIRPTLMRKKKTKKQKIAWPFRLLRKHGINKWCKALARCLLRGSQRPPFVFNLRCPRNVRLISFQCDGTVEMLALSETCSLWPSPLTWCCFIPPFPFRLRFIFFLFSWQKRPCSAEHVGTDTNNSRRLDEERTSAVGRVPD